MYVRTSVVRIFFKSKLKNSSSKVKQNEMFWMSRAASYAKNFLIASIPNPAARAQVEVVLTQFFKMYYFKSLHTEKSTLVGNMNRLGNIKALVRIRDLSARISYEYGLSLMIYGLVTPLISFAYVLKRDIKMLVDPC
jgi:hypothetical protein